MQDKLKRVLELARRAVEVPLSDDAQFLECLDPYMQHLDEWRRDIQERLRDEGYELSEAMREQVVCLQETHQQLLQRASEAKEEVAEELRELRRKGQALKAYGDVLPGRITLTGKRKG